MRFDKPLKTQLDQIMRVQADWPAMLRSHGDSAINSSIGVVLDPATRMPMRPKIVDEIMSRTLIEIIERDLRISISERTRSLLKSSRRLGNWKLRSGLAASSIGRRHRRFKSGS